MFCTLGLVITVMMACSEPQVLFPFCLELYVIVYMCISSTRVGIL